MPWLGTTIDLVNLGLNVRQLQELKKTSHALGSIQEQAQQQAALQSALSELRARVFEWKQAALTIMDASGSNLQAKAGAIALLQQHVASSGISAQVFPEFRDKEYFLEVTKLIDDAAERMRAGLFPGELSQLGDMLVALTTYTETSYYLEHAVEFQSYRADSALMARKEEDSLAQWGCGLLLLAFSGLVVARMILSISFLIIGCGALYVVMLGCVLGVRISRRESAKQRLQSLIAKFGDEALARLERLDDSFAGSPEAATKALQAAEATVRHYFAGSPLCPL